MSFALYFLYGVRIYIFSLFCTLGRVIEVQLQRHREQVFQGQQQHHHHRGHHQR